MKDTLGGRNCKSCRKYKERSEFYEHPNGANGLQAKCKTCFPGYNPKTKRDLYTKRKAQGVCVKCGDVCLPDHSLFCEGCWWQNVGSKTFGHKSGVQILRRIWTRQDGLCAYTGEKLIPGKNASVDHITPVFHAGATTEENLQWVTRQINLMKSSMPHKEFLAMCRKVLDVAQQKQSNNFSQSVDSSILAVE